MSEEFGRRLQDLVEGVRVESARKDGTRRLDAAGADSFRRHLRRAILAEADSMMRSATGVLSGLGLRHRSTSDEVNVEVLPGARTPEAHPPWLRIRFREPMFNDARVVIVEAQWQVDDPRTPLPESPCSLRHVSADDSPAGIAEVREFLAVAFEDFAACVAKFDSLPRP